MGWGGVGLKQLSCVIYTCATHLFCAMIKTITKDTPLKGVLTVLSYHSVDFRLNLFYVFLSSVKVSIKFICDFLKQTVGQS